MMKEVVTIIVMILTMLVLAVADSIIHNRMPQPLISEPLLTDKDIKPIQDLFK